MDNNNNSSKGVGFISLLTLLFIALKLCGVIKWSWFWVLSPPIISFILGIILIIIYEVFIKYR